MVSYQKSIGSLHDLLQRVQIHCLYLHCRSQFIQSLQILQILQGHQTELARAGEVLAREVLASVKGIHILQKTGVLKKVRRCAFKYLLVKDGRWFHEVTVWFNTCEVCRYGARKLMNRRLYFALSLWNFPCGCLRHFSWFIGFILTCILFLSSSYGNSHLFVLFYLDLVHYLLT
jgi:hypothetical protein